MMSDTDSPQDSHAGARHFCELIRERLSPEKIRNVLVAGCGLGHEALRIRQDLGAPVTGVDVEQQWDADFGKGTSDFTLLEGSILSLPFANDTFDVVFYHHVIEHVSDPAQSLDELRRVLVPGGLIYIGTPNRHRALGYLGSPDASRSEKIKWNIADYRARLKRKFHNEDGAHAGFSEKELSELMGSRFADLEILTADYLRFKYGARLPSSALKLMCAKPLVEVLAPSVYAVATRPSRS